MEEKYIVKVNDSILTEEDIKNILESKFYEKKYKEEYIRQWIETEVLYQEAIEKDFLEDPEYLKTMEISKKELAAAYVLRAYFNEMSYDVNLDELKNYFNDNIDEFKIFDDAYVLNIISFNDESKAVLFRYNLIESDWRRALNAFKGDESIVKVQTNQFLYRYQINPINLFRAVKNLLQSEVSIVLETDSGIFTVVQLVTFIEKFSIPNFDYVKEFVKERYLNMRKSQLYRNYINELIAKYNVKINKELE